MGWEGGRERGTTGPHHRQGGEGRRALVGPDLASMREVKGRLSKDAGAISRALEWAEGWEGGCFRGACARGGGGSCFRGAGAGRGGGRSITGADEVGGKRRKELGGCLGPAIFRIRGQGEEKEALIH